MLLCSPSVGGLSSVNAIKPINDTAETVTLSRADFEALIEEAEDRATVLEDCLLDL
jgi:hypothetical protein